MYVWFVWDPYLNKLTRKRLKERERRLESWGYEHSSNRPAGEVVVLGESPRADPYRPPRS
ncbi:MAG: hypothetical protein AAF394_04780 [Planctomycetota bacterium]